MSDHDSCFVKKLSHYISLSNDDRSLLAVLEKNEKSFKKGAVVFRGGDLINHLFVVKSGWFINYTDLPDGTRHITSVALPGDVIGMANVALRHQVINLQAVTDGELCPFEKKDLDAIFVESPKLSALLFSIAARDQVLLIDMLRANSRMMADARLAHLFLTVQARLKITNVDITDTFNFPLTQEEIGDIAGLTSVSVSRAMRVLQRDRAVSCRGRTVTIYNEQGLKALCDFQDRFADIDISWFPGV